MLDKELASDRRDTQLEITVSRGFYNVGCISDTRYPY